MATRQIACAVGLALMAATTAAAPEFSPEAIARLRTEPAPLEVPPQPAVEDVDAASDEVQPGLSALEESTFVRRVRDGASDMVMTAMNFLGVPYRRGGNSEDRGFDCSGFTRRVFEVSLGRVLPRRADQQARAPGLISIKRDELRPGDLVFFNTLRRTFSHVGIYVGEGKFIHAPRPGGEVRVEDIDYAYWKKRFTGGRRADSCRTSRLRSPRPPRRCNESSTSGSGAGRSKPARNRGPVLTSSQTATRSGGRHNCAMPNKVIPLADHRHAVELPAIPTAAASPNGYLGDAFGRPLRDLRISVTDRCNFRCGYCMPREIFDKSHSFLPQSSLLSFEEIARTARLFVAHGVQKIRLTGGEPLLRKHLEVLIGMLSELRTPAGAAPDLTMTTNGSVLARKAETLKDAGLRRITVSLDALDDPTFRRINDADFPVADVLRGIEAAQRAGLGPIKVNMVVKRGTNDDQIIPMARHFKGSGVVLRFIEYMDVGATNGWRLDEVLPSAAVIERLASEFDIEAVQPNVSGETAKRWRYRDGSGEIGVISSVTQAFCGDCNRARLSTEGKLFLCLFAARGHDLRALLRHGASDAQIAAAIGLIWQARTDRYSELRGAAAINPTPERRVEMHYIGG